MKKIIIGIVVIVTFIVLIIIFKFDVMSNRVNEIRISQKENLNVPQESTNFIKKKNGIKKDSQNNNEVIVNKLTKGKVIIKKYGNFASDDNISIKVKGKEAYINGEINTGALAIFKQMLGENPQVTTIVQGDMPGSADDNEMIALAYYVREKGLNTKLLADSAIASGGTDLFIAGVERTMEHGATIGVHSWKDQDGKDAADYPKESSEHDENVDYVNDMLGSEDFYWFTIYAAEADDMHHMTAGEISEYGLLTNSFDK